MPYATKHTAEFADELLDFSNSLRGVSGVPVSPGEVITA